jgi:hypothetical protein
LEKEWDMILRASKKNGFKKDSLLRLAKITTLEKRIVIGKLGHISNQDLVELNDDLKILFGL